MSREALSRLQKELQGIQKEPIPNAIAVPDSKNWLRWHYVIYGLDGAFSGGIYHGELRFPSNYPMGPPSILMHTPNGRFIPGQKICTSMSDFHPETWSPIWKINTIITGLISFMQDDERSTGCELTSYSHKVYLAKNSMKFNKSNPLFQSTFSDYLSVLEKHAFKEQGDSEETRPSEGGKKNWKVLFAMVMVAYLIGRIAMRIYNHF